MIGWELPPQNSGGLGVACEGLTKALTNDGVEITFTLPYSYQGVEIAPNMKILDCYQVGSYLKCRELGGSEQIEWRSAPPFEAYTGSVKEVLSPAIIEEKMKSFCKLGIKEEVAATLLGHELEKQLPLPFSSLEREVEHYSEAVLNEADRKIDDFDVVHAHDWMSLPAAMKIKRELGKPLVVHIHSTEFDRSLSSDFNSYIPRTELVGMRLADKIIAVSYYTKRLLVEKYMIDPRKISVVHNGILPMMETANPLTTQFATGRPVVVFMGRLTVQKGPEYFLTLADEILRQRPDALFVVAGNGDLYQDMLLRNARTGLSASVLFTNFLRGEQRDALLQRADVFVMPSVSEPFGLVALEAVQRGTPVVISKHSGVAEVLDDTPSFDFWDIKKMANETLRLINDKEYHEEILKRQEKKTTKLGWDRAAKKVEKIYRSLI